MILLASTARDKVSLLVHFFIFLYVCSTMLMRLDIIFFIIPFINLQKIICILLPDTEILPWSLRCKQDNYPANMFASQPMKTIAYNFIGEVTMNTTFSHLHLTKLIKIFGIPIIGHKDTPNDTLLYISDFFRRLMDKNNDGVIDRPNLNFQLQEGKSTIIIAPNATIIEFLLSPLGLPPELQFCFYFIDIESAESIHLNKTNTLKSPESCLNGYNQLNNEDRTLSLALDHLIGRGFPYFFSENPNSIFEITNRSLTINNLDKKLTALDIQGAFPKYTSVLGLSTTIGDELKNGWYPLRILTESFLQQWHFIHKLETNITQKNYTDPLTNNQYQFNIIEKQPYENILFSNFVLNDKLSQHSLIYTNTSVLKNSNYNKNGFLIDITKIPCPPDDFAYCGLVLFGSWLVSTYLNLDMCWCLQEPMTRGVCNRQELIRRLQDLNQNDNPALASLLDMLEILVGDYRND